MVRKLKKKIEVKCVIDSREQLPPNIKLDTDFGTDKIKICEIEKKCFKPLNCNTSTGDFGIEIKLEGENKFRKTKLAIEYKRGSDLFTTLFSNFKRFQKELERVDDCELDFYILHDWGLNDIKEHIKKLQSMRKIGYKTQPYITFLNNYLIVAKKYGVVNCGNNFEETTRRIIKKFIIDNKLQYDY